jgi:hypothetical protein
LLLFTRAQQPGQSVFKALQTDHIVSRVAWPPRSILIVRCILSRISFLGHHQSMFPAIVDRTLQLSALSVPASEQLF